MKHIYTSLCLLACITLSAQSSADALRYSTENTTGTARYNAMSGAFGALGGDLSALNTNPAGSAVFTNSLFTISGSNYNRDNYASYFNTGNGTKLNSLNINQAGGVFVLKNNGDSDWKKITLAINYDLATNFDNEFFASGESRQGIDNYFLNFAQGVPFGSILKQDGEFLEDAYLDIGANAGFGSQQAFLGYYGGILDPANENDDTDQYTRNANYTTVNQSYLKNTSGYNSKITLNIGTQYQENLYLGASLNFHSIVYDELKEFTERGYDNDSPIQETFFDSFLHTEGNGVSLNIGAIAKLNQFIRIGGSYQTPTWYRINDEFSQKVDSDLADDDIGFINFNVVNIFDTYTLKTPSKLTGSLAVVFGKQGLLSFDYGYQDMSKAEFRPTNDPNFSIENDNISSTLGGVSTLRIGGEYRIALVSLRAGYRYEQSPYSNNNFTGDLSGFSGGIGFNFGGSKLDFGLSRTDQDVSELLFTTGLTTPAVVNRINTNATISYTLNF
ncbi:aromatic hydrocarbon degradation protein [uncultured Maribacter sp.]|uniref:OmpP1/FadL family transporter n=1 Tax=uncultured Maribacter sp. TaxID=431308 RepID=UPI0026371B0C|nr:aromatic hydrocarbon degradation protein [uncultured Maribacter sp.]